MKRRVINYTNILEGSMENKQRVGKTGRETRRTGGRKQEINKVGVPVYKGKREEKREKGGIILGKLEGK